MATVHVTTAQQFLTAVAVEGNIIEIDNDLDFNGIDAHATIYCTEINGNGHSIYNIQSTDTTHILRFNRACRVTNIDFKNTLQTAKASFIWAGSRAGTTVTKCTFSGYYGGLGIGRVTFDKCGVNIQRCIGRLVEDSNEYVPDLLDCYIHCDLYSNTINGAIVGTTRYTSHVNNCYFSGNVANLSNNAIVFCLTSNSKNNVFNVDITSDSNIAINYVNGGSGDSANVSICNSDKISSNITVTYGYVTPMTDTQLKTPADVRATGFPLIG